MKSFLLLLKMSLVMVCFAVSVNSHAQTVLSIDNFESGFGIWNDGGADAGLLANTPLNMGVSAVIQDNSGVASSIFSDPINLSIYTSSSIQFTFRTANFGYNEDFFLEYANNAAGNNWIIIETYRIGLNINNNTTYTETVTINNAGATAFNANSRFRFRCDASADSDRAYIDNIIIRGIGGGPEIDIRGNNLSIPDGDVTPNIADNTDYGTVNVGTIVIQTFTIHNTGATNLNISSITLSNNTDFAVVGTPYTTPLASGNSTSYDIRFKPLSVGPKSTIVTLNNTDSNENPYTYVINASAEQNFFDSDGDGVYDNVDLDDDNDGIIDSAEELACKNSAISITTEYKFLNENFGTGPRTTINTTYPAVTTYCYENGTVGINTPQCPDQSSTDLNDGKYTVFSSAQIASWASQYWYTGPDHTTGDTNGRMAIFNASYDPGLFYTASIKGALPNVPVTYSFWVLNIDRSNAPSIGSRIRPNIKVEFRDANNNLLTTITTGNIPPTTASNPAGDWYNYSADLTFNVSELNVYFINNNPGGLGNDLAIDDIEIKQTLCDTDNDGIADLFDLDSDNDGIPDVVEAGLGHLSEGKATLTGVSNWVDTNGNGMHDMAEGHIALDSDGDGTPNYIDLDSDNDAIFDVDESGAGNTANLTYQNGDGDIDGDGVGDGPDTDFIRLKDFNSDGTIEFFTDGILDIYDFHNNTSVFENAYGNSNQGNGYTHFVKDTDGDGIPDYIDITSNGSTYDISHTLYANLDANNNGVIDGTGDADGDGILDLFDTNDSVFGSPRDINNKLQLYFDGRNDYAQDTNVINGWPEATIMTWIKIDPTASGILRVLGQDQFYLEVNSSRYLIANAKGTSVTGTKRISLGQWTHVAATFSSSNSLLKVYVNGALVGNTAISGALPADGSLFTIGKRPSVNNSYFKGYFDEVRIFNKALSDNELQKMVYQEIQNNGGNVRGAIIPRDVTNYISPTNIVPLSWNNLRRYFKMDTYKGNIIDDLTTPATDVSVGARIYNTKLINLQTAPLPFVTTQTNNLQSAVTIAANGVNGADAIEYDWSIVKIQHKNVTFDEDQKHLGLFVDEFDAFSEPIKFTITNDSELNVSWYLKLDGFIDLVGESQLVQMYDSQLDVNSKGKIERNQQGTADKFTYNYWSSPVGVRNTTTNNNSYRVTDVMRDGSNPINWLTSGYNGTNTTPIGIADYWIWKFANQPDDTYSAWQHVRSTGTIHAGEGFTMKGPGTGTIQTAQNYLFTGKPNNGDINLTLNSGNDYLVGNPYPSAIDADRFILDNGPIIAGNGSTTGTLYFWEHWGGGSHNLADYQGGYATYNLSGGAPSASIGSNDPDVGSGGIPTKIPGRYIPVSQGFFVVAEGAGGTIKFNNGQRIFMKEGTSNSVFVRSANENYTTTNYNPDGEDLRMKFRIGFNSVNTIHRQLLLTVDENATAGIDWGYDGHVYEDQMDDMFWMIDDEKFTIQGTDIIDVTTVVPIGLRLLSAGQNGISIDHLENVPDDVEIYVHDSTLNTYHDLRQSDYSFNLPAGEYLERYAITFQAGAALGITENELNQLSVYYANDSESIVLLNPTAIEIKSIELFNILGQSIHTIKNVESANYKAYEVKNLSAGNYILKMITENGTVSKKVLVH